MNTLAILKDKGCIYEDKNGIAVLAYPVKDEESGNDKPGHRYEIHGPTTTVYVDFQNGPVFSNGVNGIQNEALLAILINRMHFLNTTFPCSENEQTIKHLQDALSILESRTNKRIAQGVEGTNQAHTE